MRIQQRFYDLMFKRHRDRWRIYLWAWLLSSSYAVLRDLYFGIPKERAIFEAHIVCVAVISLLMWRALRITAALILLCSALPAQQLMIEAEYTSDTVRLYERIGDKHVFRCDGHRWTAGDIGWDMREGAPKVILQLNEQGNFGCSFTMAGGYTCYVFTPRTDFLETLKSGVQCIKGQLQKPVAAVTITPGAATIEAPLKDHLIAIIAVDDANSTNKTLELTSPSSRGLK